MKQKLWLLMVALAGVATNAAAVCTASQDSGGPVPHYFSIPGTVINVDADAPVDTGKPIGFIDAPTQGYDVRFDQCHTGDLYGKSVMLLSNPGASYIYPSNIPGLGVKILWNNGGAFSTGQFPTVGTMDFSEEGHGDLGTWVYPSNSYYRLEIYKTSATLNLDPQAANIVMMPGTYAYNWVTSDSMANAGQVLQIGAIQINSTPSCSFENSKTVDFGTVTGNLLAAGVDRPLDFAITCLTDYGTYSATASLSSDSASTDGSYIKVKDSTGASDALAIRIKKNDGGDMPLDGSITDTVQNIVSNSPAQFNWKARLTAQPGATAHPAEGNFTARAEILLQVK